MYFAVQVERVSLCGDTYTDIIVIRGPHLSGNF